jgi:hypothetical protein
VLGVPLLVEPSTPNEKITKNNKRKAVNNMKNRIKHDDEKIISIIKQALAEDDLLTQSQIIRTIQEGYPTKISESKVYSVLKKNTGLQWNEVIEQKGSAHNTRIAKYSLIKKEAKETTVKQTSVENTAFNIPPFVILTENNKTIENRIQQNNNEQTSNEYTDTTYRISNTGSTDVRIFGNKEKAKTFLDGIKYTGSKGYNLVEIISKTTILEQV